MRVLGIDPGLQTTGFGIVDVEGAHLHYVASGTIKTRDAAQGDLPARLKIIFDGVQEVVRRYEPTVASVEIVFVNVNPQSTLLLGQARGAALAGLVNCGLAVNEYTALQMKKAVAATAWRARSRYRRWSRGCSSSRRHGQGRSRCARRRDLPRACGHFVRGTGQGRRTGTACACAVQGRAHVLDLP
jgi:crossover junction endodeoxyribonuclease RuvC